MSDAAAAGPPEGLLEGVRRLAGAPALVLATDFDGTLAPIADQPEAARPHPRAAAVLGALAALPHTHVAVISGRALADLTAIAQTPASVELVGSHGLELAAGAFAVDGKAHLRLHRLAAELESLALDAPGARVEHKPFSVAFHYRNAEPQAAALATQRILDDFATRDGVWIKPGHMVIELMILPASKSWAIDLIRARRPGAPVFYAGDDATDEDVFADLRAEDLGCKVGDGPTVAPYRVAGPPEVVALLETLYELRAPGSVSIRTSPQDERV